MKLDVTYVTPVETHNPMEMHGSIASWSKGKLTLYETSQGVVNNMAQLFTYHLPMTYFQTYPAQIKAVTPEKVQALAGRLLKPDSMVIVAVGDRAKIEPEITKLNLGNVEIRDADAKPLDADERAGALRHAAAVARATAAAARAD